MAKCSSSCWASPSFSSFSANSTKSFSISSPKLYPFVVCDSSIYWGSKKKETPRQNVTFRFVFLCLFRDLTKLRMRHSLYIITHLKHTWDSEYKAKLLWSVSAKVAAKIHTSAFGVWTLRLLLLLLSCYSPSMEEWSIQIRNAAWRRIQCNWQASKM